MKKSKLLVLGVIALFLAGGLALASCRAGCEGAGTCEVKDGKGSFCSDTGCAVWESDGSNAKCDC